MKLRTIVHCSQDTQPFCTLRLVEGSLAVVDTASTGCELPEASPSRLALVLSFPRPVGGGPSESRRVVWWGLGKR